MSTFQFSVDEEGLAKVVIDAPDEKVNKINRGFIQELGSLLDQLKERKEIKALLLVSEKKIPSLSEPI